MRNRAACSRQTQKRRTVKGPENMNRWIIRIANSIVTFVTLAVLLAGGFYAGYAIWDNNRIYAEAGDVQADMIRIKPEEEGAGEGASLGELLKINPDVCAWVTMDRTAIDFPVLQGEDNMSYINRDVYGNFALAGSIFLDSRNKKDLSDTYSLLYGHHMDHSNMFGDLDLYKDEEFFRANRTGCLLLPEGSRDLEVLCLFLVKSDDRILFRPQESSKDVAGILDYAEEKAVYLNEDVLEKLRGEETPGLLGLSTCSSEFTDARIVLLCRMTDGDKQQ